MTRLLSLLAALVAVLVFATPARADVYDDNPATASRGGEDYWFFARAANGTVLARHWTGSVLTEWESLGGNATSGPAAVGYGSSVWVFVRGEDGAIWQNSLNGATWSGWTSLGGYATSAPAAAIRRGPLGYVDLAVKGGDNAIYFRTFVPGTGWYPWGSLGGNLTSAPAMASQSDGIVNVWARGTDGAVYQQSWDGAKWLQNWISVGGGIVGAPAAVTRTENVINLYARGAGNATYQNGWTAAGGWTGWFQLDRSAMDSSPAAGGSGPLREWVFTRQGANMYLMNWNATDGWKGWADTGPVVAAPPPTPATPTAPVSEGEVELEAGLRCTPPGGRARVEVTIRKPKNGRKARVSRITFFTKGKNRAIRVDRKAPFVVRIRINKGAGQTGRVYARVYYRRSAKGKLHRKTVSRRYVVCR